MFLRTLTVATICAATLLAGCGKKTEAELAEVERVKLRAEKRTKAIEHYNDLAQKFPNHPKAKDAAARAQALAAQGK